MGTINWYAVTTELEDVFCDRYAEYGRAPDGALYKVDGYINGVAVSVQSKFGAALKELAESKAIEVSGTVHVVESPYMFNNSDIKGLEAPK